MTSHVTLTPVEKLSLLMLCDIYQSQGVKGEFDPAFIREAIYSGNAWGLEFRYSMLFNMEDAPDSVVTETSNILNMWWRLELEYDRLSPDDKQWLAKTVPLFGEKVYFDGFSGNDETHYMGVARFFVNHLQRFEGFKGREFNSHFPSLDKHRRMLAVFEPLQHEVMSQPFTAAQLADVLKEQTHPSKR